MVRTPILTSSWQNQLRQSLTHLVHNNPSPRIAIVGIGNNLNGDDAVGPQIIKSLKNWYTPGLSQPSFLLLDAGLSPESYTGSLRQFHPGLVILIDAAQMDAPAGEVRWLPWEETEGMSASTHTLPISILSNFLTQEIGCQVVLLGVQPAQFELGQPLSKPVRLAKAKIIQVFKKIFYYKSV